MAVLASWPSMSDDDGTGQSGTVLDKALFDAIKASVEDQVHSTNNTGIVDVGKSGQSSTNKTPITSFSHCGKVRHPSLV